MTEQTKFEEWAIVDVMGHQRYVGKVTEHVIAGCGFVRIDIPKTDERDAWSKLIGTGSIYAITPVSEDVARSLADASRQEAIAAWEIPKQRSIEAPDGRQCIGSPDDGF